MWAIAAACFLLFVPTTDYLAEGFKALDAKQYDQAAQLFSQAVQADPKDYAAHFHLGLAYSLLSKDAEATAEYEKTLELKPGLYQAELNLGILLLRDKRAQAAVSHLNTAAQAKPKEFRPQLYLADALLASGENVMDNVVEISSSLNKILTRMERGEGLLGELTSDSESGRRLKDSLIGTSETLQRIAGKIDQGQGPLPRLLNDKAMANQLAQSMDRRFLNGRIRRLQAFPGDL